MPNITNPNFLLLGTLMPNQSRHKNLIFFVAKFAIFPKKEKKEKKQKKEKRLGNFSFSVLDMFFPIKKKELQIVTFTIFFNLKKS